MWVVDRWVMWMLGSVGSWIIGIHKRNAGIRWVMDRWDPLSHADHWDPLGHADHWDPLSCGSLDPLGHAGHLDPLVCGSLGSVGSCGSLGSVNGSLGSVSHADR